MLIVLALEYVPLTTAEIAEEMRQTFGTGPLTPTRQRSIRRSLVLLIELGLVTRQPGRSPRYSATPEAVGWADRRLARLG